MRTHEAGALHAEAGHRGPSWLLRPSDPNDLVQQLWPRNVGKDERGLLTVAGVDVAALRQEFGTPLYVVDEDDFRSRCRDFRDGFTGWDVYYAGKAFLCAELLRWVHDEGLGLDVCSGGELAVANRVDFPPERIT